MRKIYKIPVIGYLIRIIVSIIKLPKSLSALNFDLQNAQESLNLRITKLEQLEIEERLKELEELENEETKNKFLDDVFERLLINVDKIERLNMVLSIRSTVWGDKNRLHISPLAAVFTCFFNTNSGEITVGDYTFAGSNVSILAGSHDMFLEGLSRRDAEIKQGCDIVIGKGVWLASGCTILGPCSIGDNAVIAAGAVVVPGTEVPANTLYAGVPAKLVRKIQVESQIESQHIQEAVDRENGVLFVEGWSEKRIILYNGSILQGHWIVKSEAKIFTSANALRIFCHKATEEAVELILQQGDNRKYITVDEIDMEFELLISKGSNILSEVKVIVKENNQSELFIAVSESRLKDVEEQNTLI